VVFPSIHPSMHPSTQQLHSCHFGSDALSTPPLEMQQGCCRRRHSAADAAVRAHKKRTRQSTTSIINQPPQNLKQYSERERAREYKTLHTQNNAGRACRQTRTRAKIACICWIYFYSAAAAQPSLSRCMAYQSPPVELSHSI